MIHLVIALAICLSACSRQPIIGSEPKVTPPAEVPACGLEDVKTEMASVGPLSASETMQLTIQDPTLIGGVPAEIADWPASVYAHTSNASCSSTIIGERVLLSAGHCMSNGGQVSFSTGANKYNAVCTHHPEYEGNSTADWSLCKIDRPVTGVIFERLSSNFTLKVGDQVRLTGYGCTKPTGRGGNDGIFRIGEASVTALPNDDNYDVTTKGGAALCFGDSGGAAYQEFPDGRREIFGVNSRGNIRNVSYLPSVASSTMRKFAADWAQKNGVEICGVTPSARACRDEKIIPPPPQPKPKYDFEIRSKAACVRGKMNPGHESKLSILVDALKKLMDTF